jgi:DNA repair exonuclease SbcCD ATPase subunit|tara:strand:+ start:257 stop:898 length:642 start_codon:yes stop_codon:yes gene_type:complete
MPCTKCKDENYKWGNTGECKYATKDECEKANPKKYSKMKPTPLGKKTYEEYEKELKEYNLSATYRVELGLADDVEKLTQQAKDLIPDLDRDVKGIKEAEKNELKAYKEVDKKNAAYEKAEGKYYDLQNKMEKAKDVYNTAEREANEAIRYQDNTLKTIDELENRLGKNKDKASKVRTNLEKKLDALEKAAKELGVKIPTGESAKVLQKLISLL